MIQKNSNIYLLLTKIFSNAWIYLLLIICLYALFYKQVNGWTSPVIYILYGGIPFFLIGVICIFKYSQQSFYFLFALQFLIIVMTDSISFSFGLTIYILFLVMTLILLLYHSLYKPFIDWKTIKTPMLLLIIIWSLYCFLEIINPNTVLAAWNVSMATYVAYPLICAILIPISVKNIKGINALLVIWSIFIFISVAIAFRQQHFGFNAKETYFLYVLGGSVTHIIWSGIRYFSCFTDAANFGVHAAMAATTFGISAFFTKNKFFKIYLLLASIIALYGMFISGTRSAIAIPLGGLLLLAFLSKNVKTSITTIFLLLFFYLFFSYTHVGDGNSYIHKMRSAFHPTTDPSYVVRVENRKKMKALMLRKPLGYGLGLSKPSAYHPKEHMPYPPDSFLVSVWVETGYIGLVLYLAVHLGLFAWASWILLFRVQNKRIRGLLSAWLCMCFGFFISAYANDVMQLPNPIIIYTGFALCFAAPLIDKNERTDKRLETTNTIEA